VRRRKPSEQHGSSERWLVSYADLITLLFALFVILYAESKADVDKFKKVQESIHDAFEGVTPGPSAQTTSSGVSRSAPQPSPSPVSEFSRTRNELQESMKLESGVADLNDKVQISEDDRGLVVRLAAQDFFDDGVVEARADLRPLLDRIAKVLSGVPNPIRIEGHTDIEEERSRGWELSSERAAWVVKYWIKRWAIDPARLSAAGFSYFHPLTQRKDDYSRGKNRRVEIIVVRAPR